MVALYPAILASGYNLGMFRVYQATPGAVIQNETFLATTTVNPFPVFVTGLLLDDELVPDDLSIFYHKKLEN